ncbi:putative N,O-diacetyl muramidase [Scleroderma yunnanense]
MVQGNLIERSKPKGIDVSSHQPNINWKGVARNDISFAYIKATEGISYKSPKFHSQYTGAATAGLIRGAYHFARPDVSSGARQAMHFLANGGGWTDDGITLPGALDMEYNPYGAKCYGLGTSGMVSWIQDFSNTYHSRTGRYPVIYTTTEWWKTCTGNSAAFGATNPLWIARYASEIGALPAGWESASFWQHADSGPNPGDADLFNGDMDALKR